MVKVDEGGEDDDESHLVERALRRVEREDGAVLGAGPEVVKKCCGFTFKEIAFTIVIILMCIEVNFAVDLPASLQKAMIKIYSLSEYQFSLMYTMYFLPSMLLNTFGGYLIDKVFGIVFSTALYCTVAVIGIVLFASGGIINGYWLMLIGRFLFGMGNEMVTSVCLSYCTYTYFNTRSVNFMFSMSDNMSYVGTVVVFQVMPYLYSYFCQTLPENKALHYVLIIGCSTYLVTICLSVVMLYLQPSDTGRTNSSPNHLPTSTMHLMDIARFPAVFWLLCIVYWCFTNTIFTMETFSQGMLTSELFGMTVQEASNIISVMNFVKIALSIPFSLAVDRLGRNILFVTASCALATIACAFLLAKLNPYFAMALFGVSYSLMGSAIWTMFAFSTSTCLTGSVYGLVSAVSGLSQTVSPAIVGTLIDSFDYSAAICYYLVNASVALVCIAVTWMIDVKRDGILSLTVQERSARQQLLIRSESEEDISQDWNPATVEFDAP